MVREQYSPDRIINTFGVKFDSDDDSDDPSIGIQVLDREELESNGWGYYIENDSESEGVKVNGVMEYIRLSTILPSYKNTLGLIN